MALFEQDFLIRIVPLVRLAYGLFGPPSALYLFGPFASWALVLCFLGAHHRVLMQGRAPLASAFAITAIGFAAAYFIQFKGWPYHAIPLIGCASLALAAFLAECAEPRRASAVRACAPSAAFGPAAEEQLVGASSPNVLNAISGLRPGDNVGFLTTETAIPWSVTLQHGLRYPSRYNGFWMLRAS